jgi:hypothetical protein
MKRTTAVVCAFALALIAAPAGAAEPNHHIAIVNEYAAPMVVYAEDAQGTLHELGTLSPGEVRMVETGPQGSDEGPVRLHARPMNSKDRLSTWGDVGIRTSLLALDEDDTAILWIARDLAESLVEIRAR